ncbi:hypothetical protein ACIU4M_00850 [Bacillus altitudinis]|uniref:hypothetical protein n=1 Tax=Bacillus altitudinis TaxID=293387 RepID=UPI00389ABE00
MDNKNEFYARTVQVEQNIPQDRVAEFDKHMEIRVINQLLTEVSKSIEVKKHSAHGHVIYTAEIAVLPIREFRLMNHNETRLDEYASHLRLLLEMSQDEARELRAEIERLNNNK